MATWNDKSFQNFYIIQQPFYGNGMENLVNLVDTKICLRDFCRDFTRKLSGKEVLQPMVVSFHVISSEETAHSQSLIQVVNSTFFSTCK